MSINCPWDCKHAALVMKDLSERLDTALAENRKLWGICHAYAERDIAGAFDDLRKAVKSLEGPVPSKQNSK